MTNCPHCKAMTDPASNRCVYCGEALIPTPPVQSYQPINQPIYQHVNQQVVYQNGINPMWPLKSKITAGILAILLGGIGVHKFYLGKGGAGVLCLLFCWTGIPGFVGFIEGIIYLASSDYHFQVKNQVRLQ